jgi:hypothetical protein
MHEDAEPTQFAKRKPIEIPVPKEEDFEKLVRRAVPHRPAPDPDSGSAVRRAL